MGEEYIIMYIKGSEYNPMYKFNSYNEFKERLRNNDNVPKPEDEVVEAYRVDNLIILGMSFKDTIERLKLIYEQ